nr:outer membrane beta-barrel protein [uncultured Amphritea sp.]
MNKFLLAASVAAAVSLTSINAYSADASGGYVGVSLGHSTSDALDELDDVSGVSVDDSDTGYKVFGGYNINANFAVEGFYADLGELSATDGVNKAKVESDTFGAALLAKLPVGEKAEVFAKLGYQFWDADASVNGDDIDLGDDDGSDAVYGVGAAYKFNNVSIRVEYERFELDSEDVDLLSAGFAYNF